MPSRSKSQPHEPKLVKEYVFANATNKMKIKHENTTICIVHSTLRDATTPYMERCRAYEKKTAVQIRKIRLWLKFYILAKV